MAKKILLIDDSDILLSVEKLLLEEAGFAVRTAHSMRQFDAVMTSWAPDLILTDVNMPDVSGPELCRYIKAQLAARKVPVVLISSRSDDELGQLAQHCGADAWLARDAALEGLPARVSRLFEAIAAASAPCRARGPRRFRARPARRPASSRAARSPRP